ncbi:MAG: FkbM family methyltransferase [Candidatus Microgenomates bacterium]|jgi:FkbM family methyltransferase
MKIFLDVGAHIGQTLKIALEDKYKFDKIYCFEPVPECCDTLRKFKDKRIVVCEYGLWDKNRTGTLYAPKTKGASLFKEKFHYKVGSQIINLVRTSDWFIENIKSNDQVYLKLNCEGSECTILDDLIRSGEYKKIDVLMVDFDVRKIPSRKHLMNDMKVRLKKLGIPKIFYIDEFHLGKKTHSYFTHYWLNSSLSSLKNASGTKIYRINQTRNDLAKQFYGTGAEIGVEQGDFSEIICRLEDVKKLYSIDAWKAYRSYRDHTSQKKLDRFYKISKERLKPYNCEIIRKFSTDAAKDFADESLDFVYIDANHDYKHVYEDITLWSKKVKKGGIISGHDYIKRKGQDQYYAVIPAVNDFVKSNQIERLIIYYKEPPASWYFIKK